MFLESGWRPKEDPDRGPPRMSARDERTLMWFIVVMALLLLVAPIGGGTIVGAFFR
ncbi:hypothetical protein [Aureimonas leprariae]|uniref:hypothetical protein n=1 Tax=Plantimonas leprariae TaxID=2615207 RepID=UPI00192A56E1|nr:hypothetical protein [Aureimonas leprariae]